MTEEQNHTGRKINPYYWMKEYQERQQKYSIRVDGTGAKLGESCGRCELQRKSLLAEEFNKVKGEEIISPRVKFARDITHPDGTRDKSVPPSRKVKIKRHEIITTIIANAQYETFPLSAGTVLYQWNQRYRANKDFLTSNNCNPKTIRDWIKPIMDKLTSIGVLVELGHKVEVDTITNGRKGRPLALNLYAINDDIFQPIDEDDSPLMQSVKEYIQKYYTRTSIASYKATPYQNIELPSEDYGDIQLTAKVVKRKLSDKALFASLRAKSKNRKQYSFMKKSPE